MSSKTESQKGNNNTNFNFETWRKQLTDYIFERIKSSGIKYDDFFKVVEEYKTLGFELQQILEYGYQNSRGDEKDKIFELYSELSRKNVSKMVEKLYELGSELKNDRDIFDSLSNQSYRILEKTRHAQRSEVQYLIIRIFVANQKKIPGLLSQVFNPNYSDELFKTFIYSFLSGVLGNKQKGGE